MRKVLSSNQSTMFMSRILAIAEHLFSDTPFLNVFKQYVPMLLQSDSPKVALEGQALTDSFEKLSSRLEDADIVLGLNDHIQTTITHVQAETFPEKHGHVALLVETFPSTYEAATGVSVFLHDYHAALDMCDGSPGPLLKKHLKAGGCDEWASKASASVLPFALADRMAKDTRAQSANTFQIIQAAAVVAAFEFCKEIEHYLQLGALSLLEPSKSAETDHSQPTFHAGLGNISLPEIQPTQAAFDAYLEKRLLNLKLPFVTVSDHVPTVKVKKEEVSKPSSGYKDVLDLVRELPRPDSDDWEVDNFIYEIEGQSYDSMGLAIDFFGGFTQGGEDYPAIENYEDVQAALNNAGRLAAFEAFLSAPKEIEVDAFSPLHATLMGLKPIPEGETLLSVLVAGYASYDNPKDFCQLLADVKSSSSPYGDSEKIVFWLASIKNLPGTDNTIDDFAHICEEILTYYKADDNLAAMNFAMRLCLDLHPDLMNSKSLEPLKSHLDKFQPNWVNATSANAFFDWLQVFQTDQFNEQQQQFAFHYILQQIPLEMRQVIADKIVTINGAINDYYEVSDLAAEDMYEADVQRYKCELATVEEAYDPYPIFKGEYVRDYKPSERFDESVLLQTIEETSKPFIKGLLMAYTSFKLSYSFIERADHPAQLTLKNPAALVVGTA